MSTAITRRGLLGAGVLLPACPLASLARADGSGDETAGSRRVTAVPARLGVGGIPIGLADRRLYHVRSPGPAMSDPVATPCDQDLWDGTPIVTGKRATPSWTPTPQMLRENPRLPKFVPGGHKFNPMGARALYLGHT